jgi:hypothetical protein
MAIEEPTVSYPSLWPNGIGSQKEFEPEAFILGEGVKGLDLHAAQS